MKMRVFFEPSRALLLAALASALIVLAAFVAQYHFGLAPCHLCLLQRYPYAAAIIVALAGYGVGTARALRASVLLCGLAFLVGAGIAAYHAGVEAGLFPGPASCSSGQAGGSLEEMRAAILHAPLVTCDQAMTHIAGISLAGWNAVLYAFLTLFVFYTYYRGFLAKSHERHP